LATVNGKTIDLKPTAGMKAEAKRFQEWKAEGRRGGTDTARRRATQILQSEEMSPDVVIVMAAWFARHEVDKKAEGFRPGESGYPSPGRVAWAAWGGDAGQTWSTAKSNAIKRARGESVKSFSRPNSRRLLDKMPTGEPLYQVARRSLLGVGRQLLATVEPILRTKEANPINPLDPLSARVEMADGMLPFIQSTIDLGGRTMLLELDMQGADDWLIKSPQTINAARAATIDLCQETIETFMVDFNREVDAVKEEINRNLTRAIASTIAEGQTTGEAVNRVARWMEENARWRARRIAVTESARAYNLGQIASTENFDFVAGYKLLLSDDACPMCHAIARLCPVIRKGGSFGQNGKNQTYKDLKFPPFHPNCRCTTTVVFSDEVPDEWPQPVVPGAAGYIEPTDADFAQAEEGGYQSVAIGNAKSLTAYILAE
jgi:SPP1 gp7 family putative phage head morphogenesis protein